MFKRTSHRRQENRERNADNAAACQLEPLEPRVLLSAVTHDVVRIDVRDPNAFDNRVITFDDLSAAGESVQGTDSINGPSMVYVPDGTPNKLADYYLYFADHGGNHIRMAYGNSPTGPFTLYNPNNGVMTLTTQNPNAIDVGSDRAIQLSSTVAVGEHIASPDVNYDAVTGRFNMNYHGNKYTYSGGSWNKGNQKTFVAWSTDGLNFNTNQYGPGSEISSPYLREFEYDGLLYGLKDDGVQSRPTNQSAPYTNGAWQAVVFNKELKDSLRAVAADPATWADDPNNSAKQNVEFRHHAVKIDEANDTMYWWYTAKGEAPERIYEAVVDLDPDWTKWVVTEIDEVLRPVYDYEGANINSGPSQSGRPKVGGGNIDTAQVNELRDPDYFFDPVSGREFLYYSVAGEYGLAVAELIAPGSGGTDQIVNYAFGGTTAPTDTIPGVWATNMTANGTTQFENGGYRSDDADPQVFTFDLNVDAGRTLELSGFSLRLMGDVANHVGQVKINGVNFGDTFTNGSVDDTYVNITGQNVTTVTGLTGTVTVQISVDVPQTFRDTVIDDVQLIGSVSGSVGSSVVGESKRITGVNNGWTTVNLNNTYTDPVVIVSPASYEGSDPSTVRVRNVSSGSFEVQIDEWDYLDGGHGGETLSYLVVESGRHILEDGTILEAGNANNVEENFVTVNYSSAFSATPVVLSQAVTVNGSAAIVTRQQNVGSSSFQVKVQEEEAADGDHAQETISWVAIETGTGATGGKQFEAGRTGDNVTDAWSTINFSLTYGGSHAFLAAMQTYDGTDPTALRYRNLDNDSAQVFAEEETSDDSETSHTSENVGFVVLASGNLVATGGGAMSMSMPAGGGTSISSLNSPVLSTLSLQPTTDRSALLKTRPTIEGANLGGLYRSWKTHDLKTPLPTRGEGALAHWPRWSNLSDLARFYHDSRRFSLAVIQESAEQLVPLDSANFTGDDRRWQLADSFGWRVAE